MKKLWAVLCVVVSLGVLSASAERDLKTLQKDFLSWKFGMFIHFNMATFVPGGWTSGKEDPLLFNPVDMDFGQWADAAVAAKMKYGVFTVKHTGGWCLWDTALSDRDITWFKNYKDGKGDMVREYCEAFRDRNLKVGLYYCFPLGGQTGRWKESQTLPAEEYALGTLDALSFIKAQFTELLTNYGKIDLIWVDQNASPNGGLKPGDWEKVKAHVHSIQPECLVIGNNQTKFSRTDIHGYEYSYSLKLPPLDNPYPAEVCDKLQQGWFTNPGSDDGPVRDVNYVVNKMLRPLNDRNANYLLNCAPNQRGLMPDSVVERLTAIGRAWDPNESSKSDSELYGITRATLKQVPVKKKMLALTFNAFDDPDHFEHVAAVLGKYDAKGTFFFSEALLRSEKEKINALVKQGHEIGISSASGLDLAGLKDARAVRTEINLAQKAAWGATRSRPTLFRASIPNYDDKVWSVLNYSGLLPVGAAVSLDGKAELSEYSGQIEQGQIIEIASGKAAVDQLEALLKMLKKRNLDGVALTKLMKHSSSERLRVAAGSGGADVVSGME